ncbi:TPA: hypothetical protein JG872_000350 [Enterobacter hormaechei subsp. xiangfangensis]|nr:hypothetical protein [Enterobacter hormaechei subsp. xiangfangensis]HAV1860656.1 hypothetical protein [Enterobacter hormaechei subsp. xiangfangensis]
MNNLEIVMNLIQLVINYTFDPDTKRLTDPEQKPVQQLVLPGVGLVYNLGSYYMSPVDVEYFKKLTVENLISDPLSIIQKFQASMK